ncbi:transcriptional regulator [Methylobacterium frigidaeris]|uniref:Uncharacterized protein n=1 Tax=Methylobacterium frigidaeris TaxID=2038277 RepID=A0AA37M7D1_9HYPH|nr:transcriptional regulator [Methylobacterium frigidaeris]GJD65770.1 hypothetical protein MPEAHAMD_5965 [Methylobacterium frigidaeris]
MVELTRDEVLGLLRRQVSENGSQQAYASSVGLSPQYVADVLHGRRAPGPVILAALGVRRVERFVAAEVRS